MSWFKQRMLEDVSHATRCCSLHTSTSTQDLPWFMHPSYPIPIFHGKPRTKHEIVLPWTNTVFFFPILFFFNTSSAMVIKTQLCAFSESRIYPGHGSMCCRRDGQTFWLGSKKAKSMYEQRKKPQKLAWTQAWRRLHKKNVDNRQKKKVSVLVHSPTTVPVPVGPEYVFFFFSHRQRLTFFFFHYLLLSLFSLLLPFSAHAVYKNSPVPSVVWTLLL
jgi:ribosomal protein L24E